MKRNWKYYFYIILMIIIVLLSIPLPKAVVLKSGVRDSFTPIQNGFSIVAKSVSDFFIVVLKARTAIRQKENNLTQIALLQHELRNMKKLKQDNETLRKHLGFKIRQDNKLILCEVIGRSDTTGWWQTIRINKGTADGILPNMAVITINGLIGKTYSDESLNMVVSKYTSDVLLLTDPKSKVSCVMPRTESFGIVSGAGVSIGTRDHLEILSQIQPSRMEYIDKDQNISDGDKVYSSGLGGIYPEDLIVGQIENVGLDPSGLYQKADVVLAEDMRSLKYVFVVIEEE